MYIRHQYFIDFAEHKQKRPLYINVIRDPVEKFRSFYSFELTLNRMGFLDLEKKYKIIFVLIRFSTSIPSLPCWNLGVIQIEMDLDVFPEKT